MNKMNKISDLCHNIFFSTDLNSDLCHIYTGEYKFSIPASGFDHLKYGLEAHYTQNEYLLSCTDEELKELKKKRPKRSSLEEINYQITRKDFSHRIIKANDLVSRLPVFSQSRNRNGKQHIADQRWKNAIKNENSKVLHLIKYFEDEEIRIKRQYLDVKWTRGSFAISPAHIFPAKKDRGEDSWTPDKIVRDLSIVNKAFDKISASPLQGKHAINKEDANIAMDFLFRQDELSTTRKILLFVLATRIENGFYDSDIFSDIYLDL